MKATALFALLPTMALASPAASSLAPRQQRGGVKTLCGQYDYWSDNNYEANNNLWGKNSAQSGSQCTYIDAVSGSNVAWSSTWQWQGGPNDVKSYVYVGRKVTRGRKISQISSMPTAITWKYDNYNGLRANVAYDIFTSKDANRDNTAGDYELMIWLARLGGVYPIGQNSGTVNVGGRDWELWIGYNGAMKVFSFVAPNSGTINSWSGDAKVFFNHLQQRQNFPASEQNLIVFQVGTEAFTGGPAVFSVSQFNAAVN